MHPGKSIERKTAAMTLMEVVVVVIMMVMLFVFLLPPQPPGRTVVRIKITQLDMEGLVAAIRQYELTYDQLPIVPSNTNDDVTLGIDWENLELVKHLEGMQAVVSNSDLMIVLTDEDRGLNAGSVRNPQRRVFLEVKHVKDKTSPGISVEDFQYRDPWGNPYIISFDANRDGRVRDAFYGSPIVSAKAPNALINTNGFYEYPKSVMVWSRGPDGKADMTIPANVGVNKDNICSW